MLRDAIRIPILTKIQKWNLLCNMSDTHIGNALCDEPQLKASLQEASEREARINVVGDIFDAIFSGDRRYKEGMTSSWLQGHPHPADCVIDYAYEILKPYAHLIDCLADGNHDETAGKYLKTNLVRRLCKALSDSEQAKKHNHVVHYGGYSGYIQYLVQTCKPGRIDVLNVLYYHGSGGNAQVTKGMMDFQRGRSKFVFDIFLMGHNHFKNADSAPRTFCTARGVIKQYPSRCIRCGAFKKNYSITDPGNTPFSEKSFHDPIETGATFAKYRFVGANDNKRLELRAEI